MKYHMMEDGHMMEGASHEMSEGHGSKMLNKALKGKKFGKGKKDAKGGKC